MLSAADVVHWPLDPRFADSFVPADSRRIVAVAERLTFDRTEWEFALPAEYDLE